MTNVLLFARRALPVLLLSSSVLCFPMFGEQVTRQVGAATSSNTGAAQTSSAQTTAAGQAQDDRKASTSPRQSRRRRGYTARQNAEQSTQPVPAQVAQVSPSAEQRARDQKILEQQKAQSAKTARENDAVTKQVVGEQRRVQAEPRIQDDPGVTGHPLPEEQVAPPTQPAEPPRIQDPPGSSQTPPKPAPAPQ